MSRQRLRIVRQSFCLAIALSTTQGLVFSLSLWLVWQALMKMVARGSSRWSIWIFFPLTVFSLSCFVFGLTIPPMFVFIDNPQPRTWNGHLARYGILAHIRRD
ncbi:hypothetical protein BKA67DRAFT_574893 [Truncatella angustata]|uniref:Uncharacterized protein n=1 Tax=Truncatella angustata TaxID=152316 RepID=A0A9P8UEH3_9PEZI|nr:uncharacterized protein BKA67DRAFT_574893 [Truncatella angustata]KAH6648467.1 hypothetical protein BKA67DRAFT_574893 [Truncatella angustata]